MDRFLTLSVNIRPVDGATTFSITAFSITTFSITTLSITVLSITALSIIDLFATLSINDVQHNVFSVILLSVAIT
jgi:hypothetical protein